MSNQGHNENAVRLAALAGDAQIALDAVARGESDAMQGWIDYGAALNAGRAMFPGDAEFGKWVVEHSLSQLGTGEIKRDDRAAAMWAAANNDQFEVARADCNARTVRGIHAHHNKVQADIKAAEEKAKREAEAVRKREEAAKAKAEAEAYAKAETEALAAAAAAKSDEERKKSEAKAQNAATAKAEAEKVVKSAEEPTDEPEHDPETAKLRREVGKLTTEAMIDEIIGLRADLADTKKINTALKSENAKLKEQLKGFDGDQAATIRRLYKEIEHKSSEMYRANEKFDAANRKAYAIEKELKQLRKERENEWVTI